MLVLNARTKMVIPRVDQGPQSPEHKCLLRILHASSIATKPSLFHPRGSSLPQILTSNLNHLKEMGSDKGADAGDRGADLNAPHPENVVISSAEETQSDQNAPSSLNKELQSDTVQREKVYSRGRIVISHLRKTAQDDSARQKLIYEIIYIRNTIMQRWPEVIEDKKNLPTASRSGLDATGAALHSDPKTSQPYHEHLKAEYPKILESFGRAADDEERKEPEFWKHIYMEALNELYGIVFQPTGEVIFKTKGVPLDIDFLLEPKHHNRIVQVWRLNKVFDKWWSTSMDDPEHLAQDETLRWLIPEVHHNYPDQDQLNSRISELMADPDTRVRLTQQANSTLDKWRRSSPNDSSHEDLASKYRKVKEALQCFYKWKPSHEWRKDLVSAEKKWQRAPNREEARQAQDEYGRHNEAYLEQCPPNRPDSPEPTILIPAMATRDQWNEENPREQEKMAPRSNHGISSSKATSNLIRQLFDEKKPQPSPNAIHEDEADVRGNKHMQETNVDRRIEQALARMERRREQEKGVAEITPQGDVCEPRSESQHRRELKDPKEVEQQDTGRFDLNWSTFLKSKFRSTLENNDLEAGRKSVDSKKPEYDVHGRKRIIGKKRLERQQDPMDPKSRYGPGAFPLPEPTYLDRHGRTELQVFQSLAGIYFLDNAGVPLPNSKKTVQPASVMSDIFVPSRAASNRHRNRGLYDRCISQDMKMRVMYSFSHYMISFLYLLQILVAATLTGLSSYTDTAGVALTTLGAINTVLAGILAWLNGQGMPIRYRRSRDQYREVVRAIEDAERLFSTIDYMDWAPGSRPTPIGEFNKLYKMYEKARQDQEANYPDTHENADKSEMASTVKVLEAKVEKHKKQKKEAAEELKTTQEHIQKLDKTPAPAKLFNQSTSTEPDTDSDRHSKAELDKYAAELDIRQSSAYTALAKLAEEKRKADEYFEAMRQVINEECAINKLNADDVREKAKKGVAS